MYNVVVYGVRDAINIYSTNYRDYVSLFRKYLNIRNFVLFRRCRTAHFV